MSDDHSQEAQNTKPLNVLRRFPARHPHGASNCYSALPESCCWLGHLSLGNSPVRWAAQSAKLCPGSLQLPFFWGRVPSSNSITVEVWLALIVGVFAVAITFIIAGRVATYPSQGQSVFVVDRFTGEVELCTVDGCKVLQRNGAFFHAPQLPALPQLRDGRPK